MSANTVEISRFLSQILRHIPWEYELELDKEGWVSVDAVIDAVRREKPKWSELSASDIELVIASGERQRHEIKEGNIRALYGHSLPGRLDKSCATPPKWLFHGTSSEVVEDILRLGLRPMSRQFVHLSTNVHTAQMVGLRKTKSPTILRIYAELAASEGCTFYVGNSRVWLADLVPSQYVEADWTNCE